MVLSLDSIFIYSSLLGLINCLINLSRFMQELKETLNKLDWKLCNSSNRKTQKVLADSIADTK